MVSRLSQWEEFTEFLIEAGMVSREEMSVDAVKKYYASTLQDNTRHDDVSRSHLSPHNKLLTPDISPRRSSRKSVTSRTSIACACSRIVHWAQKCTGPKIVTW